MTDYLHDVGVVALGFWVVIATLAFLGGLLKIGRDDEGDQFTTHEGVTMLFLLLSVTFALPLWGSMTGLF